MDGLSFRRQNILLGWNLFSDLGRCNPDDPKQPCDRHYDLDCTPILV